MSWTDLIGNSRLNIKKKKKNKFVLTHEFANTNTKSNNIVKHHLFGVITDFKLDFNQNFFRVVIQSL